MVSFWHRYGCKHDAAMFEVVLKEYCKFQPELGLLGDLMIDTACLDIPKVLARRHSAVPLPTVLLRILKHQRVAGAHASLPTWVINRALIVIRRCLWCRRWRAPRPQRPSCCATTSTLLPGQPLQSALCDFGPL